MSVPTVAAGPHRPVEGTPARSPGSVRRTTTVDAWRPDGANGELVLHARGRDLVTPPPLLRPDRADLPITAAATVVDAIIEPEGRVVRSLRAEPATATLAVLEGLALGGGFRLALAGGVLEASVDDNLLVALLDELPGLGLISGYDLQRQVGPEGATDHLDLSAMVDVCAGWAAGTSMALSFAARGKGPWIMGPPAPELGDPADPLAWHTLPTLSQGTVRRARRTDVSPPPSPDTTIWQVDVMFRDSYTEGDGSQTVIHEYAVRATADLSTGRLVDIVADPRVLPATECPAAAASAGNLIGASLSGLRLQVRRQLRGTHTCTHLNDLLRTLADLPALQALAGASE